MDGQRSKPTCSETAVEQRLEIIRLHQQGIAYAPIAEQIACSLWTVGRWVRAWRSGGEAAVAYKPRRPTTAHPSTTPVAVQERIRAIRQAHPGWGARLIHRQLALDGVTALPSEVTIHAWLRRQGFGLVRPASAKPRGWQERRPLPVGSLWQADFKQKGGSPI